MKWTFFLLASSWSGVALAAAAAQKQQDNAPEALVPQQNDNNGSASAQEADFARNSTAGVVAAEGNKAANATASIGNNNNSTNNDNIGNENDNDKDDKNGEGNLVEQINGQNCINVAAMQNIELVSLQCSLSLLSTLGSFPRDTYGTVVIKKSMQPADLFPTNSPSQVDLASIQLGGGLGLNLGSVDLGNQLSVAQGILALMSHFCLGGAVDARALLDLGADGQVQMLLQLAQLAQLQSRGALDVVGAQDLIQSNVLLGGSQLNVLSLGASRFFLLFLARPFVQPYFPTTPHWSSTGTGPARAPSMMRHGSFFFFSFPNIPPPPTLPGSTLL